MQAKRLRSSVTLPKPYNKIEFFVFLFLLNVFFCKERGTCRSEDQWRICSAEGVLVVSVSVYARGWLVRLFKLTLFRGEWQGQTVLGSQQVLGLSWVNVLSLFVFRQTFFPFHGFQGLTPKPRVMNRIHNCGAIYRKYRKHDSNCLKNGVSPSLFWDAVGGHSECDASRSHCSVSLPEPFLVILSTSDAGIRICKFADLHKPFKIIPSFGLFPWYEMFPDVSRLMPVLAPAPQPNTSAFYGEIVKLRVWIMNSEISGTRLLSSLFA